MSTVLDSEGEPLRLGHARGPDLVSPNELEAEELVGHEFADEEDRLAGVREMVELGAREAIMTLPDGCLALLGDGTGERARLPARPSTRSSRCPRSAPATPSWRATWRPATTGSGDTRTACASRSPAAPSPPSTSAPAWSTRARWSASGREVGVEQLGALRRSAPVAVERSPESGTFGGRC